MRNIIHEIRDAYRSQPFQERGRTPVLIISDAIWKTDSCLAPSNRSPLLLGFPDLRCTNGLYIHHFSGLLFGGLPTGKAPILRPSCDSSSVKQGTHAGFDYLGYRVESSGHKMWYCGSWARIIRDRSRSSRRNSPRRPRASRIWPPCGGRPALCARPAGAPRRGTRSGAQGHAPCGNGRRLECLGLPQYVVATGANPIPVFTDS